MHAISQNFSLTLQLFSGGHGGSYRAFLALLVINRETARCEVTAGEVVLPRTLLDFLPVTRFDFLLKDTCSVRANTGPWRTNGKWGNGKWHLVFVLYTRPVHPS